MASASLLGTVGRTVAAAALHEQLVATLLGFLGSLSDQSQVGSLLLLVLLGTSTLQSDTDTLALQLARGHETLNLWCLVVLLATLGGDLATHDILAHILGVAEVEELANLGGTLRPKTDGALDIGDTWQRGRAILDDHQVEHGQVLRHDAATDGLALHLTSATLTVALGALAEQQAHTLRGQDTLQHRETLLVVATGDLGGYPLNSSPRESRLTSAEILLSKKGRSFLSSSMSMDFWAPVSGHEMLSFIVENNKESASPC